MSVLVVRQLVGLQDYQTVSDAMHAFTDARNEGTADELWLLEHSPVFSQGQAGKSEHLLTTGDIPVIQSDRGGQVTYHGPGQLVVYCMIDLGRKNLGPRHLVSLIEDSLVELLKQYGITAYPKPDAPGVYVEESKIASLGLRIRKGKSFHGLALNIDMDLEPFLRINPCGYAGMQMTQMRSLVSEVSLNDVAMSLVQILQKHLQYSDVINKQGLP